MCRDYTDYDYDILCGVMMWYTTCILFISAYVCIYVDCTYVELLLVVAETGKS